MAIGEYTINVPVGSNKITASKEGYIPQPIENVEVLEGQTTIVNIQLGGDNMGEYIVPTVVKDGNEEIVNVPIVDPTVPRKFLDGGLATPLVGNTVELLTEDEATVLQTEETDSDGRVVFTKVLHGKYNLRIKGVNI